MKTVDVPSLVGGATDLQIRFPETNERLSQDAEWCEAYLEGEWRRFRFHDYGDIYNVPGLYECLFYRTLKCNSPVKVVSLLKEALDDIYESTEKLRVLDLGAGNGMVGYELQTVGVDAVVGTDIIIEGEESTRRDRPWAYDDYITADFTALTPEQTQRFRDQKLNCLTCVAALGFGDIPREAFINAIDLIDTPGWIAFNIKEDFMSDRDNTGFARLIRELEEEKVMQMRAYRHYRHRLSSNGDPLYYGAMIARKLREVPESMKGR